VTDPAILPASTAVDWVRVYALTPEQALESRTLFPGLVLPLPPLSPAAAAYASDTPVAYNVETVELKWVPWRVPIG
jgi:hypothetical protein